MLSAGLSNFANLFIKPLKSSGAAASLGLSRSFSVILSEVCRSRRISRGPPHVIHDFGILAISQNRPLSQKRANWRALQSKPSDASEPIQLELFLLQFPDGRKSSKNLSRFFSRT